MSDKPQLPGYSVDDDTHDDNDDAHHIDVATTEPEHPGDPSSSTPPNQQEEGEEHPTVAITTVAATPTTPPPLPVDEFADPKISGLHTIFPDYDVAILHSIVDSVGGDQDRAVDALLAMSDPDHVPAQHATAEQTQLDEEFARQLLLEDEQQYARDQIALRQQQQEQMRQFPYAQRTHPSIHRGDAAQQQQQQQSLPQRDTMSDMQEQFSKFAETGKRTFSTLVSKVKAKVQDFDQQRNTPDTSSSSGTGTSIGTGYAAQPPSPGVDRHAQQAYYAPRVSPNPQPGTINDDDFENPPSVVSSSVNRGSSASTPPPPTTNNGPPVTNIDPGKIGLLPKRPVSLVNTESQSSEAHDEDEEELEYLENPFEEGKYS
ncbi:hypothetical protein V8E52_008470 [Russula decolorans]